MSVRLGKIPVVAAANVAIPESSDFVFVYIDSVSGKISWRKSDGTVVTVTSA